MHMLLYADLQWGIRERLYFGDNGQTRRKNGRNQNARAISAVEVARPAVANPQTLVPSGVQGRTACSSVEHTKKEEGDRRITRIRTQNVKIHNCLDSANFDVKMRYTKHARKHVSNG